MLSLPEKDIKIVAEEIIRWSMLQNIETTNEYSSLLLTKML